MKKQHLTKLVALTAMAIAIAAIIWGFAAKKAFAGAPGTYTITYNANGGTINGSSTMQVTFVPSSPVSITSTVPTKSGCNFLGWSTSKSATSATYKKGQGTVRFSGNVTLYAVWQSKGKYTIKFVNGSSSYTQTAEVGQKVTLKKCTFSAPDVTKKFGGWATESSYGLIKYTDGATVDSLTSTVGATVTLTAKWAARTYKIEYREGIHPSLANMTLMDYSDALAGDKNKSYVNKVIKTRDVAYVGMTVTLESARSYSGYTFVGWGNDPVNPTVVFKADSKADVYTKVKGSTYATTIVLYGLWCPTNAYSYKISSNGGYWYQNYDTSGYSVLYIPKAEAARLIKAAYGTKDTTVTLWEAFLDTLAYGATHAKPHIDSLIESMVEGMATKGSFSVNPAVMAACIGVAVMKTYIEENLGSDLQQLKKMLIDANIGATESTGLKIYLYKDKKASKANITSVERWNSQLMYSTYLTDPSCRGYWSTADEAYSLYKSLLK